MLRKIRMFTRIIMMIIISICVYDLGAEIVHDWVHWGIDSVIGDFDDTAICVVFFITSIYTFISIGKKVFMFRKEKKDS